MADVEKKVEDLERIARAAQIAGVRWVSDHAPTDEVLAVEERSSGVSVVAKINPMAEWTDDTALAWVEHIATFDPPTVLALIERVKVLEGALEPFANHYRDHELTSETWGTSELLPYVARDGIRRWLRTSDFRRARSALSNATGGEGDGLLSQPRSDGTVARLNIDAEPSAAEVPLGADGLPKPRLDMGRRRFTRCQADDDGYCEWGNCPQLRDDEPARSGRHCPLDRDEGDE